MKNKKNFTDEEIKSTVKEKTLKKNEETTEKVAKKTSAKKSARSSKKVAEKAIEKTIETETEKKIEKAVEREAGERFFALDIGTRSVIGIVAEEEDGEMKILATARKEHKTRSMLDGQIHDVPEVASIIRDIKEILEKETGPLKSAAVAAAGRALYTVRAEAETKISGTISRAQEKNLDFLGVQEAQTILANSKTVNNPANYYCVGYSTITYILDDMPLKSLVGQRGNVAKVSIIATFLPRQVINSMQSALLEAGLYMRALTLEPIAAINVLIPPTMRHLNLALVDIGAGTSDVALTKDGAVFAYGMVPLAGDEITEALSQKFLLDFKVAENVKRLAASGENAEFSDILGMNYNLSAEEILEPVLPAVRNLAEAISQEIINLNGAAPQALILVGGGALTPNLAAYVSEILNMPPERVAVRKPEKVEGIANLPQELQTTDSVTPLGILKIASINTLYFLNVYVNGEEHNLFNFKELNVSDALLNAGVSPKKFGGRPGLALTVTVNGEAKFFPGDMGSLAKIKVNGKDADLETRVKNEDRIEILRGEDGKSPKILLKDVITESKNKIVRFNGKNVPIVSFYTINGEVADFETELKDGDIIETREKNTTLDILKSENIDPEGKKIHYTVNGKETDFTLKSEILLNGNIATLSTKVNDGDVLKYNVNENPTLKDALELGENKASLKITFNKNEYSIPAANVFLTVNGENATEKTVVKNGADIVYKELPKVTTSVSDALLAVNFQPPAATSRMKFDILVNGKSAEFIDPIKNGDSLEVVLTKIGEPSPVKNFADNISKENIASKDEKSKIEKTSAETLKDEKSNGEKTETEDLKVEKSKGNALKDDTTKDLADKTAITPSKNIEEKAPSKDFGKKEIAAGGIKDLADRAIPVVGSFKERFDFAKKFSASKSAETKTEETKNENSKTSNGLPNIPGLSEAIAASKK